MAKFSHWLVVLGAVFQGAATAVGMIWPQHWIVAMLLGVVGIIKTLAGAMGAKSNSDALQGITVRPPDLPPLK